MTPDDTPAIAPIRRAQPRTMLKSGERAWLIKAHTRPSARIAGFTGHWLDLNNLEDRQAAGNFAEGATL